MSLSDAIFGGLRFGGYVCDPSAQRALTQNEIQELQIRHYREWQENQSQLQLFAAMVAANYRPPVHVPEGWAAWYAIAEELR